MAAIEDPAIARRILECIGLPARAPPIAAAAPGLEAVEACAPELDDAWSFDQTAPDGDAWD
jgi:hypothetical protein